MSNTCRFDLSMLRMGADRQGFPDNKPPVDVAAYFWRYVCAAKTSEPSCGPFWPGGKPPEQVSPRYRKTRQAQLSPALLLLAAQGRQTPI